MARATMDHPLEGLAQELAPRWLSFARYHRPDTIQKPPRFTDLTVRDPAAAAAAGGQAGPAAAGRRRRRRIRQGR